MPGAPPRYPDSARELVFAAVLDRGETVGQAVALVKRETGIDMKPRSARALAARERLRRERDAGERAYLDNPAAATADLARRIFALAATVVRREESRARPDLVRLQRAAKIVRELRPIVGPRDVGAKPRAPLSTGDNGHGSDTEAARLTSALEASREG